MTSTGVGASSVTDVSQSPPRRDLGGNANPEVSFLEELQRITQQVAELELSLEQRGKGQVVEGVDTGRLTSEISRLRNAVADVDADRRARHRETQQLRATVSACDAELRALRCAHSRTTRAYEEAVRREAEERVAHAATFDQLAALRSELQEKLTGECCVDLPSITRACRPSAAAANREVARLTIENSVLKARVAAMEAHDASHSCDETRIESQASPDGKLPQTPAASIIEEEESMRCLEESQAQEEQSERSSPDAHWQQHAPADQPYHSECTGSSPRPCRVSSPVGRGGAGRGPLGVRVKEVPAQEADASICGAMDAFKRQNPQASASSLGTEAIVSIQSETTLMGCSDSAIQLLGSPDGEGHRSFSRNTSVATVAPVTSAATELRDTTAIQQQALQLRIRPSVVVTPPVVAPPLVKPVPPEVLSARRLMCPSPRSTPALQTLRFSDESMYRSGDATPSASAPALKVPAADSQREGGETQRRVARCSTVPMYGGVLTPLVGSVCTQAKSAGVLTPRFSPPPPTVPGSSSLTQVRCNSSRAQSPEVSRGLAGTWSLGRVSPAVLSPPYPKTPQPPMDVSITGTVQRGPGSPRIRSPVSVGTPHVGTPANIFSLLGLPAGAGSPLLPSARASPTQPNRCIGPSSVMWGAVDSRIK